ncbi:PrsW family intramembrane metalloprotease [candidate division KSB1 bacterium]|nr:PrsW family intramembrane metalloprotease [candidate division KSB1 bacterium]
MAEPNLKAFRRLENVSRAGFVNFISQVVFLLLVYLWGNQKELTAPPFIRAAVLIIIVFIPSILWTLFFYIRDRREPEPVSYTLLSFLAGMAGMGLVILPLHRTLFRLQEWIHESSSLFVFGSFLVYAPVICIILYFILRYGFYSSREFDEPVDGMVYGAFAGCGMAFVYSVVYGWTYSDNTIFAIGYTATTHVLIYSGVGAVIGYAIGKAKFSDQSIDFSSALAIFVGTFLLGGYFLLDEFIFIYGFAHAFWLSFFLTLVYVFLILLFCTRMMKRLTRKDLHRSVRVRNRLDVLSSATLLLLLLAGGVVSHYGLQGKVFKDLKHGVRFCFPHSMSRFPFQEYTEPTFAPPTDRVLFISRNMPSPQFVFSLSIVITNKDLAALDLTSYIHHSAPVSVNIQPVNINHRAGKRLAFSYLKENEEPKEIFPALVQVYKDFIQIDNQLFIFTYRASSRYFTSGLYLYENILQSVKWQKAGGRNVVK